MWIDKLSWFVEKNPPKIVLLYCCTVPNSTLRSPCFSQTSALLASYYIFTHFIHKDIAQPVQMAKKFEYYSSAKQSERGENEQRKTEEFNQLEQVIVT